MNGTIRKRPLKNGRAAWSYTFDAGKDEGGKRRQMTKSGFPTKAEASDALRRAIEEHQSGILAPKDSRKFADFFGQWLKDHASRRCSPKTLERYGQLGEYAIRKFGDVELHRLAPMAIEKALFELQDAGGRPDKDHPAGRPLASKTVRHVAFLVHGCLDTAVRWGVLGKNPMDRVELPKLVKPKIVVLDKAKLSKILTAAEGTRLYPLILLAAATGCRRGELLALTWADIDFTNGVVNVNKSLEETKAGLRVKTTKSGKPRRFSIPASALAVIEQHRAEQDRDKQLFGADYVENGLVFCRPEGNFYMPDKVSVRVTELTQKLGFTGAGLHSFRHSHASELLSKGVPIPTVSSRLGHANPNVTLSIYAHAIEADELAAAKIWDDAMSDVISETRKAGTKRMLANVSAGGEKKLSIVRKQSA
jgi:integrase